MARQYPYCWDFEITIKHKTLGRTPPDEWSARRSNFNNTRHSQETEIHVPGGTGTSNPSKAAADPHLTLRGHGDRHKICRLIKYKTKIITDHPTLPTSKLPNISANFDCSSPQRLDNLSPDVHNKIKFITVLWIIAKVVNFCEGRLGKNNGPSDRPLHEQYNETRAVLDDIRWCDVTDKIACGRAAR
jgi:hypothetical protein